MNHCNSNEMIRFQIIYILSIKKYKGVYLPEPTWMNSPVASNMNLDCMSQGAAPLS